MDVALLTGRGIATAFELKIGRLQRVLEQAAYNRSSFHRSWVVTGNRPRSTGLQWARELGLGLLVVQSDNVAVTCQDRPCLRVVCSRSSAAALDLLLADLGAPEQVVVWVSGLDEYNAPTGQLAEYRRAVASAAARGQEPFGLYGAFFSVLLGAQGLRGTAHGVGFSEHRNWRELPESGAPPPRYYLRRSHRYVGQDLAQQLWDRIGR